MSLHGRHVVVTRPVGQSVHLAEALVAAGATPVLFPVLEIAPLTEPAAIAALVEYIVVLDQYDLAVFISPNAVEFGLAETLKRRTWPAQLRVATVGQSSEAALQAHDLGGQEKQVLCPQGRFDSEALLDLPALQNVAGKRILVFRGNGGRELLAEALKQRGASVDYAACYTRHRPDRSPDTLFRLWEAGQLDAITVTSSEGLHNLVAMLGPLGHAWLKKTPLFVPHARIAAAAEACALHNVTLTAPADVGLMTGLLRYFDDERNPDKS
ncbi:MAG TPA: uroporphyrinogen-III synthase [Rhodocyclaceae bacterium]|nr:uroporphyrinogen-III synthase [Rhodocyclaceae bacterium]